MTGLVCDTKIIGYNNDTRFPDRREIWIDMRQFGTVLVGTGSDLNSYANNRSKSVAERVETMIGWRRESLGIQFAISLPLMLDYYPNLGLVIVGGDYALTKMAFHLAG